MTTTITGGTPPWVINRRPATPPAASTAERSVPVKENCTNQPGLVRRWCPNAACAGYRHRGGPGPLRDERQPGRHRLRSVAGVSVRPHFRCRVKNRAPSSTSNHGVPACPPGLACSVFSLVRSYDGFRGGICGL